MTVKHLCVLVGCTENSHSLGEEGWFLGEGKRKYKFKSATTVSFLETSDCAKNFDWGGQLLIMYPWLAWNFLGRPS